MSLFEIFSLIINLLVMIAGCSAIPIYFWQKHDKVKTAATIVLTQIDSVESIIKEWRCQSLLTKEVIYRSKCILDSDSWSTAKYLLARKLGASNTQLVDEFFTQAECLEKSRQAISHGLVVAWEHKDLLLQKKLAETVGMKTDERKKELEQFDEQFEQCPRIFDPQLPVQILNKNLAQFKCLTGTTAYEKLSKISYHS